MTKEEMQMIREMLREELEPINKRLDGIEDRLAAVEENTTVTREAVNSLIEWAENVAVITQVKFPVPHKKAE